MTSPAPDAPRAANRRGVLAMCGAMACLVANDTLVKFASQSLPASELIFVRGVFATALLLVLVRVMGLGAQLPALLDRRVLLRALLDGLGTLAYLISLFHLPLANTNAINMAAPLFITVFAALLFHERVAAARWAAVGVGFTGVLLVGMITGIDGSGFAGLPLTGTLSGALGPVVGVDPATLAAVGQMGAVWTGGGTLIAWSSLIAVAGFARVHVLSLVRALLLPVVLALFVSTICAVLIWR